MRPRLDALLLLALIGLFVLVAVLIAAPVRIGPPKPPPAIQPGRYVMTWLGTPAETVFHADGFYACHWMGNWWHGRWSQKAGLLEVEEWPMAQPDDVRRWKVKLATKAKGDMSGTAWSIVPYAGDVH